MNSKSWSGFKGGAAVSVGTVGGIMADWVEAMEVKRRMKDAEKRKQQVCMLASQQTDVTLLPRTP